MICVEKYGNGYIVANYDDNIKPLGCHFYGAAKKPKTQPIGLEPFPTEKEALAFKEELEKTKEQSDDSE